MNGNQGQFYCSLYSQKIPESAANLTRAISRHNTQYWVANSWAYTRSPEESNVVYVSSPCCIDILELTM